jgi:hypothetical protein
MDTNDQWVLELPIREKLYQISLLAKKARLEQEFGFHHGISWETIEVSHMEDGKFFFKRRTKTSFGNPSLKGHLPSLKTSLRPPTGSSILALASSAGCLAMSRTNPPSHTFPFFSRSL